MAPSVLHAENTTYRPHSLIRILDFNGFPRIIGGNICEYYILCDDVDEVRKRG